MKQLQQQWEDVLSEYGLSAQQIENQELIPLPTPTAACLGIQPHQFDKYIDDGWRDRLRNQIAREQLYNFHEIPVELYPRTIPAWACSDNNIRTLLMSLYPKLHADEKHLQRAAAAGALIYRYFRLFEPASSIAADLGENITTIEKRIERIKLTAAYLGL